MGGARLFLKLDTAFRQRQRLIVAVLHQRDVRLVAANRRQHVARFNDDGQALRLPQRRHCLVQPSLLSASHAGE